MSRNFNSRLTGFRDSIANYGYYIDFEKVHRNVDGIRNNLEETFDLMENIYSIKDLENGVISEVFK